jgi:hypothetical protein
VTVYITNDGNAEPTETVTVTLDEDEDYLLGNDSDTLFVRDNDTRRIVWTGGGLDGEWTNDDNWVIEGTSTHVAPLASDDVYFTTSGTGDCINAGDGLSTLAGLHIVGSYDGVVTLANELSVGTFELTSGTLDQPDADYDLLVTDAILWIDGGTLGSTDDGADVIVDGAGTGEAAGAWGRINPPDTGSMAIASTLKVVNGAKVTILPGTLDFTGGNGLFIAGEMNILTGENTDVVFTKQPNITTAKITIDTGAGLSVVRKETNAIGKAVSSVPILNKGTLTVGHSIAVEVLGRFDNGPSIKQESGETLLSTGSSIRAFHGMTVTGGSLYVLTQGKTGAMILGKLTFDSPSGVMKFVGAEPGKLVVAGDVDWKSGGYQPAVDGNVQDKSGDLWLATGTFTVTTNNVWVDPFVKNGGNIVENQMWTILEGVQGINGDPPDLQSVIYDILVGTKDMRKWWNLHVM